MTKLTDKQDKFCLEYLVDLNATQAAIRAGYSKKTAQQVGSENLTKPVISNRIAEARAAQDKRTEITADYVLSSLVEVAERCMQRESVMTRGPDGMEETGEWKFEHSGANKALELLGRHKKLFTDKIESTNIHTFEGISEEDLDAKLQQLEQAHEQSTKD